MGIQKKMDVLDIFHLLVRTPNMNDGDKEAKVCGTLTKFIRKLTNLFFLIIGEKFSKNLPLNKTYSLIKMAKLIFLYGPMYLPLYEYPPYPDKQYDIFEANINKEFRCIRGLKNHGEHNVIITWVSVKSW